MATNVTTAVVAAVSAVNAAGKSKPPDGQLMCELRKRHAAISVAAVSRKAV